jgi:hypothetical protein
VPVGAGGGDAATPACPDVDVVVARPDVGPVRCLDLDGSDPPVAAAGGRVDGEEIVEGGAGAVGALWGAVVPEVGGAGGLGLVAGGRRFEVGAPALTVVETGRLRS